MLIVRLACFALGGVVCVVLRTQFKLPLVAAVILGTIAYVAVDLLVEPLLFG
jgi:hypothetical protein